MNKIIALCVIPIIILYTIHNANQSIIPNNHEISNSDFLTGAKYRFGLSIQGSPESVRTFKKSTPSFQETPVGENLSDGVFSNGFDEGEGHVFHGQACVPHSIEKAEVRARAQVGVQTRVQQVNHIQPAHLSLVYAVKMADMVPAQGWVPDPGAIVVPLPALNQGIPDPVVDPVPSVESNAMVAPVNVAQAIISSVALVENTTLKTLTRYKDPHIFSMQNSAVGTKPITKSIAEQPSSRMAPNLKEPNHLAVPPDQKTALLKKEKFQESLERPSTPELATAPSEDTKDHGFQMSTPKEVVTLKDILSLRTDAHHSNTHPCNKQWPLPLLVEIKPMPDLIIEMGAGRNTTMASKEHIKSIEEFKSMETLAVQPAPEHTISAKILTLKASLAREGIPDEINALTGREFESTKGEAHSNYRVATAAETLERKRALAVQTLAAQTDDSIWDAENQGKMRQKLNQSHPVQQRGKKSLGEDQSGGESPVKDNGGQSGGGEDTGIEIREFMLGVEANISSSIPRNLDHPASPLFQTSSMSGLLIKIGVGKNTAIVFKKNNNGIPREERKKLEGGGQKNPGQRKPDWNGSTHTGIHTTSEKLQHQDRILREEEIKNYFKKRNEKKFRHVKSAYNQNQYFKKSSKDPRKLDERQSGLEATLMMLLENTDLRSAKNRENQRPEAEKQRLGNKCGEKILPITDQEGSRAAQYSLFDDCLTFDQKLYELHESKLEQYDLYLVMGVTVNKRHGIGGEKQRAGEIKTNGLEVSRQEEADKWRRILEDKEKERQDLEDGCALFFREAGSLPVERAKRRKKSGLKNQENQKSELEIENENFMNKYLTINLKDGEIESNMKLDTEQDDDLEYLNQWYATENKQGIGVRNPSNVKAIPAEGPGLSDKDFINTDGHHSDLKWDLGANKKPDDLEWDPSGVEINQGNDENLLDDTWLKRWNRGWLKARESREIDAQINSDDSIRDINYPLKFLGEGFQNRSSSFLNILTFFGGL
jgi:hypothetical protein